MITMDADGLLRRWRWIGALSLGVAALLARSASPSVALGVLVGGVWNGLSVWSLSRALSLWQGITPSQSVTTFAGSATAPAASVLTHARPPGCATARGGCGFAAPTNVVKRRERMQTIIWLIIKFPLLYLFAIGALVNARVSPLGFGLGITVTLVSLLIAGLCPLADAAPSSPIAGEA